MDFLFCCAGHTPLSFQTKAVVYMLCMGGGYPAPEGAGWICK